MYTGTVYRGMEENIFQLHRGMFIRTDPETTRRLTRRQAELGASDFRKGFAFFFLEQEEDMTNYNIPVKIPAYATREVRLTQHAGYVGVDPVSIEPDNFQLFELLFGLNGLAKVHMRLEGLTRWEPDEREWDEEKDTGVAYVTQRDSPLHSPHPKTRTYLTEKTLPKFEFVNHYPFEIATMLGAYAKKFNLTQVTKPEIIERLTTGKTKWVPISVTEFVQ